MEEKTEGALPRPEIEEDSCKGCGRCVAACPKKCLSIQEHMNRMGIRPVGYAGNGCIGCGMCFYTCPEPYALRVVKS